MKIPPRWLACEGVEEWVPVKNKIKNQNILPHSVLQLRIFQTARPFGAVSKTKIRAGVNE